jgi:hypothetical protein
MIQRQVKFSVNEIAFNPGNVENCLNKLCAGPDGYWVRGVCQFDQSVTFVLLPRSLPQPPAPDLADETVPVAHHLVLLQDLSEAAVDAELMTRWTAGFETIGAIDLGDSQAMLLVATR